MKIGIIRETKIPVDNRVALSPEQAAFLAARYPGHRIVVQSSTLRAFSDGEYKAKGIPVVEDVSDCDVLFGIKEVRLDNLLPDKKYFFFGHFAKMQEYNKGLLQTIIEKGITFCDYEYLVGSDNKRVCAFGWWAGIVGVYYTLRGYGLKTGEYELPKNDVDFSVEKLLAGLKGIKLPAVKIVITGEGRVSQGAQWVLNTLGIRKVEEDEFLGTDKFPEMSYCVAGIRQLVKNKKGEPFSSERFKKNPEDFESDFEKWSRCSDVLICGHFWDNRAPVYLDSENLRSTRIRMIGDITCDIKGSIKSTLRSSTHDAPFYDYNPVTCQEETAFSSDNNITVMAVDTCPNALPRESSSFFGEKLMPYVFEPLLNGEMSDVEKRGTIVEKGIITERFSYLKDFVKE